MRTHALLFGFISCNVVTSSSMTSCKCSSKVERVPDNAVEISPQIKISDTLVSLEQKSDCSGNGLSMGRGTTRQCHGFPMMFEIPELHKLLPCIRGEQAEISSSCMVHVMPRKPTWLDRCVKAAANSE